MLMFFIYVNSKLMDIVKFLSACLTDRMMSMFIRWLIHF
jgi:hypothetical protein